LLTHWLVDNLVHASVWTTIEPTAAIVTICIPSVRSLYRAKRKTPGSSDPSTANIDSALSIREVAKYEVAGDVEIGEIPPTRSEDGLRSSAHSMGSIQEPQQHLVRSERAVWPPVTMLLESERPFARFEEFDGRRKS